MKWYIANVPTSILIMPYKYNQILFANLDIRLSKPMTHQTLFKCASGTKFYFGSKYDFLVRKNWTLVFPSNLLWRKIFFLHIFPIWKFFAGCSQGKKFQVFLENTWIAPCEGKNTWIDPRDWKIHGFWEDNHECYQ